MYKHSGTPPACGRQTACSTTVAAVCILVKRPATVDVYTLRHLSSITARLIVCSVLHFNAPHNEMFLVPRPLTAASTTCFSVLQYYCLGRRFFHVSRIQSAPAIPPAFYTDLISPLHARGLYDVISSSFLFLNLA